MLGAHFADICNNFLLDIQFHFIHTHVIIIGMSYDDINS